MTNNQEICYLDANFLIAYFASNHKDYKNSRKCMFNLLKEKKYLNISCLSLDETFYYLKKVIENQIPSYKRKPMSEYYENFSEIVELILDHPLMEVIQFLDLYQSLNNVIENIKNYNLKPRDAFHYALMQDRNIEYIVTKDKKDFEKIPDIKLITY